MKGFEMNIDEFYKIEKEILSIGGWGRRTPEGCCRLLYALVRMFKPEYCLETGTFVGISALWIARALEENQKGKLYSTEIEQQYVDVSRKFLERCGLAHRVELIFGDTSAFINPNTDGFKVPQWDFVYFDDEPKISYIKKFETIEPLIKKDSLFIIHDTFEGNPFEGSDPVIAWLRKERGNSFEILQLDPEYGIAIMKKL